MVKRTRIRKQRGGAFSVGQRVIAIGVGFGSPRRPANEIGTIIGSQYLGFQLMYQIRFDNSYYKDELLPEGHLRLYVAPAPGGFGAAAGASGFGSPAPSGFGASGFGSPAPGGFSASGFGAAGFGSPAAGFGASGSGFGGPAASAIPNSRFSVGDIARISGTGEEVIIRKKDYIPGHGEWGYGVVDKDTPKGKIGWVNESDLEEYSENGAANNNSDGVIRYVISSHGGPSRASYSPPANFNLAFFTEDGRILSCPNVMQTIACLGTQDHKVKEWVYSGDSTTDYLLSKDTSVSWKSGAVDCATKTVVFNLEAYSTKSEVPLSHVMRKIEEYHYNRYGDVRAIVYCLFCRGGGEVNRVEPGKPGRRRKTRRASKSSRKNRR